MTTSKKLDMPATEGRAGFLSEGRWLSAVEYPLIVALILVAIGVTAKNAERQWAPSQCVAVAARPPV
jgi:hypothetical protein